MLNTLLYGLFVNGHRSSLSPDNVDMRVLFLNKNVILILTVLVKKKVAKHTRTLRENSRGACAHEAFALFAY